MTEKCLQRHILDLRQTRTFDANCEAIRRDLRRYSTNGKRGIPQVRRETAAVGATHIQARSIHPPPQGSGQIANEFEGLMNYKYGWVDVRIAEVMLDGDVGAP